MYQLSTKAAVLVLILLSGCICAPLDEIFSKLEKKQNDIKEHQIMKLLEQIPNGLPAKQPALAEYHTFDTSLLEKFVDDGTGKLVFREFRRGGVGQMLKNQHARNLFV